MIVNSNDEERIGKVEEEWLSLDRRCILAVSNDERRANNGLRVFSKKSEQNKKLINISSKYSRTLEW